MRGYRGNVSCSSWAAELPGENLFFIGLKKKNRFFNCVLEQSLSCMLFLTRHYLWHGFWMNPVNSLCTGRNEYFKATTKFHVLKQTPWGLLKYPCMCLYLDFFFLFSIGLGLKHQL